MFLLGRHIVRSLKKKNQNNQNVEICPSTSHEVSSLPNLSDTNDEFEMGNIESRPTPPLKEYFEEEKNDHDESTLLKGFQLYLCICVTALCFFLTSLDATITMPLITFVSNKFNSFDKVTWIMAGFLLGQGCFTQIWGTVAVLFGRKWCMLVGIFIFEIGSLIGGVSTSMNMFIVGRVIQGIGASSIQTCSYIIIAEITPIQERPKMFAFFTVILTAANTIGPVLGGVFTSNGIWRWCFYINLCLGGVIAPIFYFSYKQKTPSGTLKEKFQGIDYIGGFLMIGGFVLPLVALSLGVEDSNWKSANPIGCFISGGISLILFVIWNFEYSEKPLIPLYLVNTKPLFFTVLSIFFGMGATYSLIQFIFIYFEVVLNEDALSAVVNFLAFMISRLIASGICARLIRRTKFIKPFGIIGGILLTVGSGILILLNQKTNSSGKIGLLIVSGAGSGALLQSTLNEVQVVTPKVNEGTILSTAFFNLGLNMGAALFSLVSQIIYSETLKNGINEIMSELPSNSVSLTNIISSTTLLESLPNSEKTLMIDKVLSSIHNVFYLCVGLGGASLIFSLFMSNKKLPDNDKDESDIPV